MAIEAKRGDVFVTWTGLESDEPSGRELTVDRVTKTLIIMTDGSRWDRTFGQQRGDRSFRPRAIYRPDDPRMAAAAEKLRARAVRTELELALRTAAYYWVQAPTDENTTKLTAAVTATAEHLGLKVLGGPGQCTFTATDLDGTCLMPADHVDTGQWHKGLGWVASIRQTTED